MKRKIIGLSLIVMLVLSMTACGSKDKLREFEDPEDRVYVDESEFDHIFDCPDEYVGKYIKVVGRVADGPERDNNEWYIYQAWHDIENSDRNFAFRTNSTIENLGREGYVQVEGKIVEDFGTAKTFHGVLIEAVNVTPLDYIEAMAPTLKEIVPQGASTTQNNITVQVDKVQYAETETRVFITMDNASDTTFRPDDTLTKLILNDQELEIAEEEMSNYWGQEYGVVPYELLSHTKEPALIVFPPIDQNTSFQLHMEGSSVDKNVKFEPYDICIPVE